MTQATPTIGASQSGLQYRTQDNDGKKALLSHHKGATAPSYAEAGIIWLDDTATPWLLKTYDGADWITLGAIDATNNTFSPYNGTAAPRTLNHATDTGSANAYVVAPSPAITAYTTGQVVTLKPAAANTGASTLNVNSLGTKNIKLLDGSNPAANALLAMGVYVLMYDGTNFVVLNPSQPAFTGDSGSGGAKGLVPAPAAGDAAANKVLGAGGGWVSSAASMTLNSQSANYTLLAADKNQIVELTGGADRTFSFTAAATLGSGWFAYLRNNSTAELMLDPNGAETIDGLAGYKMYPGEVRLVQCSGTAFTTLVIKGGAATFDSSGSWTRPPGYTSFDIEIWGGGQSGASRASSGNAAGGAGGWHLNYKVAASALVSAGSTETVTVGGTAARVSGNAVGNIGNDSNFTINGVGMSASQGAAAPGSAASSTAVSSVPGYYANVLSSAQGGAVPVGSPPQAVSTTYPFSGGGGGGSSSTAGGTRTGGVSYLAGKGGDGGTTGGSDGGDGTAPGGGGGGAVNGGTSGMGAAGRVIVRGLI